MAVCGGGVLALFVITSLWGSHSIFSKNVTTPLVEANGSVKDLVNQDSNGNGIADWEESLWGLDPKGDGAKNKSIIDQKKAAGNLVPASGTNPLNETDKFSQGLLSTIIALNQSGSLTPEAIARISETVSKNINVKHANIATYSIAGLATVSPSASARTAYEAKVRSIISPYDDLALGSELSIIESGLTNEGGAETLAKLQPYADAYADIGTKLMALKTPSDIAFTALDMANSAALMSAVIPQIENIYTDAITGMIGIGDYIDANNRSDEAAQKMRAYFGIE